MNKYWRVDHPLFEYVKFPDPVSAVRSAERLARYYLDNNNEADICIIPVFQHVHGGYYIFKEVVEYR